jgi:hypothetical protein
MRGLNEVNVLEGVHARLVTGFVQVFAMEPAFSEDVLQKALERARALQGRVQMPPAMLASLERLLARALELRSAAMPAEDSLQSSVDTVLALTLPETGAALRHLRPPCVLPRLSSAASMRAQRDASQHHRAQGAWSEPPMPTTLSVDSIGT